MVFYCFLVHVSEIDDVPDRNIWSVVQPIVFHRVAVCAPSYCSYFGYGVLLAHESSLVHHNVDMGLIWRERRKEGCKQKKILTNLLPCESLPVCNTVLI